MLNHAPSYTYYNTQVFDYMPLSNYSASSTINDIVWQAWVTTSQVYTTNTIWNIWNAPGHNIDVKTDSSTYSYTPPEIHWITHLTAGIAAAARIMEEQQAQERAKELLLECCTEEQKAEYLTERKLTVYGHKTKHVYTIRPNSRVACVSEKSLYCINPKEIVPEDDAILTKKLLLEYNEDEFLRIANRSNAA